MLISSTRVLSIENSSDVQIVEEFENFIAKEAGNAFYTLVTLGKLIFCMCSHKENVVRTTMEL